MKQISLLAGVAVALMILAACNDPGAGAVLAWRDLSAEIRTGADGMPPGAQEGLCWAEDILPATAASSGPASRSGADGQRIWFRAPCSNQIDGSFVATLQRALKARGYYRGAIDGKMNRATRAAIGLYQGQRGLASEQLSLAAAKDMGLVETALDDL
jgi:hypothetical protein